jgi:hypothetical protein
MADNQMVKIVFDFDLGNVPASAKKLSQYLKDNNLDLKFTKKSVDDLAASMNQLSTAQTKAAQTGAAVGNSVKKSNMQWTNLALVIQDLPYGFRGIQNNLPALMGGIAGMAGPLYLVGSAVIALFTAWDAGLFKTKNATNALNEAQKQYNETLKSSMGSAGEEIAKMNALVSIAKNQEISMQKRLKAVKSLQDEYPSYFGNLDKEKILNGDVSKATDGVKTAIIERAKATAVASKINKLAAEKFAKDEELYQLALQKTARVQAAVNFVRQFPSSAKHLKGLIDASVSGIRDQENAIKSFVDSIDRELNRLQKIYTSAETTAIDLGDTGDDKKNKGAAAAKKKLENAKKEADKLALYVAKRLAASGGETKYIAEPELDPSNAAKAFNDKMAYEKKASKDRVAFLREQYQLEVSEAEGSFDKIKLAEENMRLALDKGFMDGSVKLSEYIDAILELRKKSNETVLAETKAVTAELLKIGIGLMNALGPALDMLLEKGASIGDVLSRAFEDIIKKLIKVAIAAAIAVAIISLLPGGQGKLAKAGGAMKMFGNLVGGGMGLGSQLFANGGIVSGPTMGLMGEYPGAKTNPEVVAPLDKLKSMIGSGGGSGEFVLRGNDLILAIQRSNSSLKLRRG